jgi:hypothetical protein
MRVSIANIEEQKHETIEKEKGKREREKGDLNKLCKAAGPKHSDGWRITAFQFNGAHP